MHQARLQLEQLHQAGLCHAELAVEASTGWVAMARELVASFPSLRLGAASVRSAAGLEAALAAGLTYAVSPILDPGLLAQARVAGITLVPGVFSPSEIVLAVQHGAVAVKLFPATALGPGYWRSLAAPLAPLPFCIAAGGISVADVPVWLAAGVDAVALGSSLFVDGRSAEDAGRSASLLRPELGALIARLQR